MYATAAILPLLVFAMGIAAAPMPAHSVARAVPDINAVVRNPAPIDDRVDWNDHGEPVIADSACLKDPKERKKLEDLVHHLGGRDVADLQ
jgi:hypothetical protein